MKGVIDGTISSFAFCVCPLTYAPGHAGSLVGSGVARVPRRRRTVTAAGLLHPGGQREAADFAVAELVDKLDHVSTDTGYRRSWVATVARNHARQVGKKLHRDLAMGRAGSLPPPMHDELEDERVELLIGEMRSGGGVVSLGSLVAAKVDFDRAWALISEQDQRLLDLKYTQGMSSKEIAELLGKKPGTIDNQLTAAKKAAVLLFADLQGVFDQDDFGDTTSRRIWRATTSPCSPEPRTTRQSNAHGST